ncbi:MAG: TldD/PmbA family protein [Acidimicrobiales bacterium]
MSDGDVGRRGVMPDRADEAAALLAIADRVVAAAKPGEDLEVVVGRSASTSIRAYEGEVESLTIADVAGIGVRVVAGGRQGFASAGSLDADVVDDVLADARDNLTFAEPDDHVLVARPDGVVPVELDLWRDDVVSTPTAAKVELAIELERRVRAGDPRITGVRTCGYGDRAGTSAIATTTGIRTVTSSTSASASALALAAEGDEVRSGGGSTIDRGVSGLDLDEAAADAVSRATELLGAGQPDSGRVTLVLEPRLAATLLGIIGGMVSGERALKGRTPFADRVGERIAAPLLTMICDPTDPDSYGARRFDGEGLAARRNDLIIDGELCGFLHHSQSAARAGVASTASAVRGVRSTPSVGWHALSVRPGSGTHDELVSGVADGIVVRSMSGLHSGVNAVSGDFSVGVEGRMIRNGELAEGVREATVASTLLRLLADISAVGADIEALPGGVTCPTLVIGDVALSGR